MKVLPIDKVREADQYTIKNEPIDSIELMERAARACFKWIFKRLKRGERVKIFTGLGNNGGDGLAIGRLLVKQKILVDVYILRYSSKISTDFKTNYERLGLVPEIRVHDLKEGDPLPDIAKSDIVIDAIFGSGLKKPIKGFIADVIHHINESNALVIAIDSPSGLFSDTFIEEKEGEIIKADYTLSFEFPKYSFFLSENDQYVGDWKILSINLSPDFIKDVEVKNYYTDKDDILHHLKKRLKFSHKGNYGHALLISGSYGKLGAAVLASRACLRSGVGLLTSHVPKSGNFVLQTAVPEAMIDIDEDEHHFSGSIDLSSYNAIGIGPGIGMDDATAKAFKFLIQNTGIPMVIDADAINILGENKTWISFLPPNCIITPHPKEFERIAGKTNNSFDRIKLQRTFSIKNGLYIVLKGANTSVTSPDGRCYFNSTGNPGMATAGSGDVLTGIILGLYSQGYSPLESSIIGVYLHGLAGDLASSKFTEQSMIANDIIDFIPQAYKQL